MKAFFSRFGIEYVALVHDEDGVITNQAVFKSEAEMNEWYKHHVFSGLFADKKLICTERHTMDGKPLYIDWNKIIIYALILTLAAFMVWKLSR